MEVDDETSAETYMGHGFDHYFSTDAATRAEGRSSLAKAAALGRSDAYLYIGKSFEIDREYLRAAEAYRWGLEHRHRASVYRLARLHGKGLVPDADREFYLRTIKRLASERHCPSMADCNRERIKGSYGIFEIAVGVVMFLPVFVSVFRAAYNDPDGWRMQR
jgi:hypothetical protein